MTDTQNLLKQIAALRQRLEPISNAHIATTTVVVSDEANAMDPVSSLEQKVKAGNHHLAILDGTLRQLMGPGEIGQLPSQLTARARRLLERGRELLGCLRKLNDEFDSQASQPNKAHSDAASMQFLETDPMAERYHQTVAMTDSTLRMLQVLPDAPVMQLRLCEGIDGILEFIADRISELSLVMEQRREENATIDQLTELLRSLVAGEMADRKSFVMLGENILAQAQKGIPVRFSYRNSGDLARMIACQSVVVAQVAARVMLNDVELHHRPLEAILAGLIHDAGMLSIPADILTQPGRLNETQRRALESHTRIGAEMAALLMPGELWLAEATADHHERLDGTGYPSGLKGNQIRPLTRLLAVCDVYAAQCTMRPYRPAKETRTALADTLLMADQGALDRNYAEKLLALSFYPIGSVVELSDGAVGVVVATHEVRRDLMTPARPVLAMITDSQGRSLPRPHHVDLAQCEGRSIVRSLPQNERGRLLAKSHPELL